jgi:UDP-3-O-[3-hydroxymyristoyl] N-acetylglucosamine deacetylase
MPASHLQHTVAQAVRLIGVGVHSGAPATLVIKPAPVNHGIVFVRSDMTAHDNRIPARWDMVADTRLCTVLKNAAGASVSTVEHVMSALAVLGIDNAEIAIDGPEVPIMDGSAQAFVDAIDTVGRRAQALARRVIRVIKPVMLEDGDKTITLLPADEAVYSFDIEFANPVIGRQTFSHRMDETGYRSDIAYARTFGFLAEVEALRAAGLGRGGSLDNAIVVDGDRVLNPDGLRSPTEFVRHKILDAIGDIALAGLPLIARYHGVKAGHALNNRILHALFADETAYVIETLAAPQPARARAAARPVFAGADLVTA